MLMYILFHKLRYERKYQQKSKWRGTKVGIEIYDLIWCGYDISERCSTVSKRIAFYITNGYVILIDNV